MEVDKAVRFQTPPSTRKNQPKDVSGYVELKEKIWRKVWLALEKNYEELNFYNTHKDKSPFLQINIKHAEITEEEVSSSSDEESKENKDGNYCFSVKIFGKVFLFTVKTKEDLDRWINALHLADKEDNWLKALDSSSSDEDPMDYVDTHRLETRDIDEVSLVQIEAENDLPSSADESIKQEPFSNLFDILPDEALIRIWGFLDAPNVGKAAQVCKRFKQISYDLPLWEDLAKKRNWDAHKPSNSQPKDPTRSFYIRKFLSFRRREKLLEEQRIQSYKTRLKQRDRDNSGRFLLCCCFGRPYEWFAALSIIWITVLASLKLDGHITWDWGVIFIPLYLVIIQILFAPIIYDLISSKFSYTFEEELDPDDNQLCGPIFFFLAFILPMSDDKSTGRSSLYPVVSFFVLFLIFAIIRIAGVSHLPWWAVFLPLYVVIIYTGVIIMWIAGYDTCMNDDQRFDRIVPVIGNTLLILFLIFLSLKLDGAITWSWYIVMTPLFILKGLVVLIPIILSILTLYFDQKGSYWLEDRTRWPDHLGSYCITATLVILLVLGPLLTFELLLAQRLEHKDSENQPSYALIFIPLFILEGFGLCGCCIVNCAFFCS